MTMIVRRHPERSMAVAIMAGIGIELFSPDIGWLGQVAAVLAYYARLRRPARSLWVLGLLIAGTPWKLVHGDGTNLLLAAAGPALGRTLGELRPSARSTRRPGPPWPNCGSCCRRRAPGVIRRAMRRSPGWTSCPLWRPRDPDGRPDARRAAGTRTTTT
jgi:hypothetical protein